VPDPDFIGQRIDGKIRYTDYQEDPRLETLRKDEYASQDLSVKDEVDFLASYTTLSFAKVESTINILRTTFIVIVLGLASVYFTKDAQTLVLDPLERMIEKIKAIAKNPLVAATEEVNEAGVMSFMSKNETGMSKKDLQQAQQYETAILEKAIVKIGHLLALGFGEAGGGIIGQNMTNGGELNPMMPG
jgi:hypothetical protein